MDKIESLFNRSYNLDEPVVYFPIRHHSPICSFHLKRTIESYQPDCILIEGPQEANSCITQLVDKDSVPPLSVFCTARDTKGIIGEKDKVYRSYFPFLEYSPEFFALKLAADKNIPSIFIDLPYSEQLHFSVNDSANSKSDSDYALFHSAYIAELCKKEGCRNFNELWEKHFEIAGLSMKTGKFVKNILAYAHYARIDYSADDLESEGTLAREYVMAKAIKKQRKSSNRILVVAGAWHIQGIVSFLDDELMYTYKAPDKNPVESAAHPMIYSFRSSDQNNGYASGMPYPSFYQQIWKNIDAGLDRPYNKTLLKFVAKCGAKCRDAKAAISISDEIESYHMAEGLRLLRNKNDMGAFELQDSIQSAFVKADQSLSTSVVEDSLNELLTGDKVGKLENRTGLPALANNFYEKLEEFGISQNTKKQEKILEIYDKPKHKKISEFFHIMSFLETDFCEMYKGPDLSTGENINLIREYWAFEFNEDVISSLIEKSSFGVNLQEAATNLLTEKLNRHNMPAGEASELLINASVMGLQSMIKSIFDRLSYICSVDGMFTSVVTCMLNLNYMNEHELLSAHLCENEIHNCIYSAYKRSMTLMTGLARTNEHDEDRTAEKLKDINFIVMNYFQCDSAFFTDKLVDISNANYVNSTIDGAVHGLLYGLKALNHDEIIEKAMSYFSGTGENPFEASKFLKGLFLTGRDILLSNDNLIKGISTYLDIIDERKFLSLVPNLRLAFSFFTPYEVDSIAERVVKILNPDITSVENIDLNIPGKELNQKSLEQLKTWGIYG